MKKISILSLSLALVLADAAIAADKAAEKATKTVEDNKAVSSTTTLKSALHELLPSEKIHVQMLKNSVVLSGTVSNSEVSHKAERLAKEHVGANVLNFLHVKTHSNQVMLRVRVGEVKRTDLARYGINMAEASFDYMHDRGIVKLIAEPNLVAMSGEKAEFLSGGEFPVPTVQSKGAISVDYKPYGVRLSFTPHVLSSNKIRLHVAPEVSELKAGHNLSYGGFSVPVISSRRADTTVELANGESFMIAGLVKQDNLQGATELVISVTPYLVEPVHSKDIVLPYKGPSTKLEGRFVSHLNAGNRSLNGPVGFIAD